MNMNARERFLISWLNIIGMLTGVIGHWLLGAGFCYIIAAQVVMNLVFYVSDRSKEKRF
jgi:hypothetical protein